MLQEEVVGSEIKRYVKKWVSNVAVAIPMSHVRVPGPDSQLWWPAVKTLGHSEDDSSAQVPLRRVEDRMASLTSSVLLAKLQPSQAFGDRWADDSIRSFSFHRSLSPGFSEKTQVEAQIPDCWQAIGSEPAGRISLSLTPLSFLLSLSSK